MIKIDQILTLNAQYGFQIWNGLYRSTAELGFFAILRNLIKYTRYMLGGQYFISLFALKMLRNILLKRKFVYLYSNKFTSSIIKTNFFFYFSLSNSIFMIFWGKRSHEYVVWSRKYNDQKVISFWDHLEKDLDQRSRSPVLI